nr:PLDc N-terminal domain-containing protein [Nocardioides luti]
METNYLVPSAGFVLLLVAYAVVFVLWPLWQALRAGQLLWALVIFFLSPLGAIAWYLLGRDRRRS